MSEIGTDNPFYNPNDLLSFQSDDITESDDYEEENEGSKPTPLFQSESKALDDVENALDGEEKKKAPVIKKMRTLEEIIKDTMEKKEELDNSDNIVSMFEPTYGKDIRNEYPDLDKVEEFKNLTSTQLSFVWAYANKTSPFYKVEDEKEKISKCCLLAFRKKISKEQLENYLMKQFPDTVALAIPKMEKYNPSFRMRAKLLAERQFTLIDDMTNQVDGYGGIMSLDEKKKFADFINTSTSVIPKIVDQIENAYGVKLREVKKKDEGGMTDMDKVMDEI